MTDVYQLKMLQVQMQGDNEKDKKIVVFSSMPSEFIKANKLMKKSNDEVEEFILMSSRISVTYEEKSDVATTLTIL